jgi:DNA replication protein DnaC
MSLDKSLIMKLSTCNYIHEKHNAIVLGASGAGKSYMACALGVAACRNFLKTRLVRLEHNRQDICVRRHRDPAKDVL